MNCHRHRLLVDRGPSKIGPPSNRLNASNGLVRGKVTATVPAQKDAFGSPKQTDLRLLFCSGSLDGDGWLSIKAERSGYFWR